jgi:restriction system protein
MALWMVRAGQHGEQENLALENGLVVVGYDEVPDLSGIQTREELRALCEQAYPDAPQARVSNYMGQLWGFVKGIKPGDLVALPLKARAAVAVGRARGPYTYRPDQPAGAKHGRPVEWLRTDVPRTEIGQDLLYSLGAFMTVCQVNRNNAEERFQGIIKTGRDPNLSDTDGPEELDLEEIALDAIRGRVEARFKAHDFARLVAALLNAQGYHVFTSPPGPDGGVDVVAGGGPMGFDPPRLCVQVKSGTSPVDVGVLRELQGVMRAFGAEHGLLVSWTGFKESVYQEARRAFFEIRLWDSNKLLQALLQYYESLPEDIQTELPLKRIWTLVPEE